MNHSIIYDCRLSVRGKRNSLSGRAAALAARSVLSVAILMGIGLTPARFVEAQGITGSITGTVTDSTGAAISGATITVRNLDTNATHIVTSSEVGSYTAPQLVPGHYSVKAVKAGFKSFEDDSITLQIDQVASINPSLSVGSENTTVEVTLAPPAIQTDSSSIGEVVDSAAIQNAPLNGRLSLMGLIAQAPGVQGVGPQDQLATRGETFAVGTGSRNSYGSLGSTLEGVTNAEITLQRAEPEVPSLDAISEFKVLTSSAPAEFGQPIQVIVVSASGSNKYHGELFEYNRSKGTQAKYYYAPGARPSYERNEYGGNFSGPITIPHLYHGKDRSFFFFSYEGFRLNQSAQLSTMQPSEAMRKGDFSGLGITIVNPVTGLPFQNNQITGISPVSQTLMNKLIPCPTLTTFAGGNCQELVPYTDSSQRFALRLDHRIGPNDQIRFTFLHASYGPNPTVGNDSLQGGRSGDGEKNTNMILGWTHTFSPTTVLDSNASFFHLPIYRAPQNVGTVWESIIPGLAEQYIEGAPQISFSDGVQGIGESGSHDLEQTAQINTSLTRVFSRHTLKAGVSFLYDNHYNVSADSPAHGAFNFTGQYSGEAFADFLLGFPSSTGQGSPSSFITRNISNQWAAYIQDDWKPTPKLTINAGLRYDLQWFFVGPYNDASLWVPSLGQVAVFGSSSSQYTIPINPYDQQLLSNAGLLTFSSDAHIPNNPFAFLGRPDKNVAPRLGFAYQLPHNTVLRGAYGLYFNLLPSFYVGEMWGDNSGGSPFIDSANYTNSTSGANAFTMSNPFPAGDLRYSGNTEVNAEHSLETPYSEQYNLALEHQFPGGVALRIGYVGQHTLKMNNFDGNGNFNPYLNLSSTLDPTQSLDAPANTPIPLLGQIPYYMDPIFHTLMNSLQVGVHKQFSHGLSFGAEYQWTRVLGTESIQNYSGSTPNDSYGPIAGITPQNVQINYAYQLPLGTGKALLGKAGPVANAFLGGWQISGLINAQTGQPFNPTFDPGVSQVDFSSAPALPGATGLSSIGGNEGNYNPPRPNRVPGVPLYPAKKTHAEWFNPAAFSCPVATDPSNGKPYCFGYGNAGYDLLRGPAYQDWDVSLQKNNRFEHYNLQLRADAFNVFNHPSFGTPNSDLTASGFGTITSTPNPPYNSPAYEPRTLEFGLKLSF